MSDGNLGHNRPPAAVDTFRDRLALYAKATLELPEITEATAGKWRDHIGLGKAIAKDVEATHKVEKAPFLEGGKKVDAAYKPLADEAKERADACNAKLSKWVIAERDKADRIAREKAEELRKAEEAARIAAEAPPEDDELMAFLNDPAPDLAVAKVDAKVAEAEALAAKRVTSEAGGFRASALVKERKARVTDLAALAAHYAAKGNTDLRALLQKLADAELRHAKGAPVDLPGVEIYETEKLR